MEGKLAENNINTQNSLMKDIVSNYSNIIYSITERGKEMMSLLKTRTLNEEEKTVTISMEDFEKLMNIAYILESKRKHDQLGILAESAVPDNELKIEILNKLKA